MSSKEHCPNCNALIQDGYDDCSICGLELCPDCRAPLTADAVSCGNCGLEFALFCPRCDSEITAESIECSECGMIFAENGDSRTSVESTNSLELLDVLVSGSCPECDSPILHGDSFCRQCGLNICPHCGREVDEEARECANCGQSLTFDCPGCSYELLWGSQQCPVCNVLIPAHCGACLNPVVPGQSACVSCGRSLSFETRATARVVQSFEIGDHLVRIVACPGCGHTHDPAHGPCPRCAARICVNCQLILADDEKGCINCGQPFFQNIPAELPCPGCGQPLPPETDACPQCQQLVCPVCIGPLVETDQVCPSCGAEFEILCPDCGSDVAADDEACGNCGLTFSVPTDSNRLPGAIQ